LASSSQCSEATVKRAWAGDHISLTKHEAILAAINARLQPREDVEYPWPTVVPTGQENWSAEKIFQAYSRTTIYGNSIQLAEEMFKRCNRAKQFLTAAHWADHAAGEYRKQGKLRSAQACLDDCFGALNNTPKRQKSSVEMRLLLLRA